MKKWIQSGLALTLVLTPSLSKSDAEPSFPDTAAAGAFFNNELSFKTNSYGVKHAIETRQNVVIVDVRREEDFKKGHIPGAISLPFEKYASFQGNEATFPGLKKNVVNIIYCYKHGCNLAQKAAVKFASLGYPVKEMVGGFDDWKAEGYPVAK